MMVTGVTEGAVAPRETVKGAGPAVGDDPVTVSVVTTGEVSGVRVSVTTEGVSAGSVGVMVKITTVGSVDKTVEGALLDDSAGTVIVT